MHQMVRYKLSQKMLQDPDLLHGLEHRKEKDRDLDLKDGQERRKKFDQDLLDPVLIHGRERLPQGDRDLLDPALIRGRERLLQGDQDPGTLRQDLVTTKNTKTTNEEEADLMTAPVSEVSVVKVAIMESVVRAKSTTTNGGRKPPDLALALAQLLVLEVQAPKEEQAVPAMSTSTQTVGLALKSGVKAVMAAKTE